MKAFVSVSALLALVACGTTAPATSEVPTDVKARVSDEIATVVRVTWTTREPSAGYVEYGPTRSLGDRTPLSEAAGAHEAPLFGLKPDEKYFYRVVSVDDTGEPSSQSELSTFTTDPLPGALPHLERRGIAPDFYTLVPIIGRTTAVTVVDGEGDIVWYHQDERALDFYRARLGGDGQSIVYNAASASGDPAEGSELVTVSLDGETSSSIAVPLLAHDFVQLPGGGFAAIGVEYRQYAGGDRVPAMELRGNRIVEIDPDGQSRTVWTTWDCFDPDEVPGEDIELAWSNANALDYDAADDAYLLGMRNFSSIVKIRRDTWECEWVLGSYGSTFEFAEGSLRFLHQHQFELEGHRLLVLDNDGSIELESRVLEYELDFERQMATQIWSYLAEPPVYTFVLGEPTRLPDETLLVNWSAAGQMDLVGEDGSSSWSLNLPAGFAFGFHTVASSLYPASTGSSSDRQDDAP